MKIPNKNKSNVIHSEHPSVSSIELERIEKDLDEIQSYFSSYKSTKYRTNIEKKMRVLKAHIYLEQLVLRLKSLLQKDFLLLPQDKAIMRWSQNFLTKIIDYFRIFHELQCKQLWIRLFLIRTTSYDTLATHLKENHLNDQFGDELMNLPARFHSLKKTTLFLTEALKAGEQKIAELRHKYQLLEVSQVNSDASRSLPTRIGPTFQDASQSPLMKSLVKSFLLETASIREPEKYGQILKDLEQSERRQYNLLTLCRQHAERSVRITKDEDLILNVCAPENFGLELQNLRKAEIHLKKTLKDLIKTQPSHSHPIIVQTVLKRDNTMDI